MPEGIPYPELETKEKLDVLIVDGGMRGEALKWAVTTSDRAGTVETTPFDVHNPMSEVRRIGQTAVQMDVDLAIVSQDNALQAGVTDNLRANNIAVCGVTQEQAQLESSKSYMKELALQLGIPTSLYRTYTNSARDRKKAHHHIDKMGNLGVIKDDFLAEGKASTLFHSNAEGHVLLDRMFAREFNNRGEKIIIEHYSKGRERSGHVSVSGSAFDIWPPAEDHKQLQDDDLGPMTGGMGVATPLEWADSTLMREQDRNTIQPLIKALPDIKAILFPGYKGIDLLEMNARPGSPETEAYVRNIASDFLEHIISIINGTLHQHRLQWRDGYAISIAAAAEGYPHSDKIVRGEKITGIEEAQRLPDIEIFLGSVAIEDGEIFSDGGRLLAVTATGTTIDEARDKGYEAMDRIRVGGRPPVFRTDIGKRAA